MLLVIMVSVVLPSQLALKVTLDNHHNDTLNNNAQHNDIQQYNSQHYMTLSMLNKLRHFYVSLIFAGKVRGLSIEAGFMLLHRYFNCLKNLPIKPFSCMTTDNLTIFVFICKTD